MSVVCRQTVAGEPDQTYRIEPHHPGQSDRELLAAKAQGAADKGWAVEWAGDATFTATKERWGGAVCVRLFWIE